MFEITCLFLISAWSFFRESSAVLYLFSHTNPSICDARTHYSKIQLLQQITATPSNNYIQFILFSQMSSSSFLRISVIVCYSPRDSCLSNHILRFTTGCRKMPNTFGLFPKSAMDNCLGNQDWKSNLKVNTICCWIRITKNSLVVWQWQHRNGICFFLATQKPKLQFSLKAVYRHLQSCQRPNK